MAESPVGARKPIMWGCSDGPYRETGMGGASLHPCGGFSAPIESRHMRLYPFYPKLDMGLFTQKTPEEAEVGRKRAEKETLEKYGLDLESYSIQEIEKRNVENLRKIANDLRGNKWFKAGLALSFAKAHEQATVTYLSALVEQNWILLRQNEIIIKELQKLGGRA